MKPLNRVIPPSGTMALDQQARMLAAAGRDIINLTAGQVDLPMPQAAKAAVISALEEDRTGYVPASGSAEVKAAVGSKMGWQEGEILISAGAKPLVQGALACIAGPGDEVLLPTPCYTSYPHMITLAGAKAVLVTGEERRSFHVTPEALEAACTPRTKALLFNHPTNPTGAVYGPEELEKIVGLCEAHDLYIIADEVYDAFTYEGPCTSLYHFAHARNRLVLVNSASKTFAMAGLRIGFGLAPAPVAQSMTAYLSHTLGCPCSLSERAAKAALEMDDSYREALKAEFASRRRDLCAALADIPGISFQRNEGAFYLWLKVSALEPDDVRFCQQLLEREGVALTPGSVFLYPGYVRLAYTKKEPLLLEAARRLKRFIENVYISASGSNS